MLVGTQQWGEERWGYGTTHSHNDLRDVYGTFMSAGINFFDTAEAYGKGEAEELLGEFHRDDGRPMMVATKFAPERAT